MTEWSGDRIFFRSTWWNVNFNCAPHITEKPQAKNATEKIIHILLFDFYATEVET